MQNNLMSKMLVFLEMHRPRKQPFLLCLWWKCRHSSVLEEKMTRKTIRWLWPFTASIRDSRHISGVCCVDNKTVRKYPRNNMAATLLSFTGKPLSSLCSVLIAASVPIIFIIIPKELAPRVIICQAVVPCSDSEQIFHDRIVFMGDYSSCVFYLSFVSILVRSTLMRLSQTSEHSGIATIACDARPCN